jgi:hypothetical protein
MTNNLVDMDDYKCAGCGSVLPRSRFHEFRGQDRTRPVTSRCKACRSEAYYESKYLTKCACCLKSRELDVNLSCKACNEASGLRQCLKCGEVLPLYLKFYGRSRTCKNCQKGTKCLKLH